MACTVHLNIGGRDATVLKSLADSYTMDSLGKVSTELWKQCAGQVVDGVFPLQQYLGGNANAVVYLTEFGGQKAAIKLVRADPKSAEPQLARWQAAATLSHPHLIKLLKSGRCQVAGGAAIYVVNEYVEEDLSQVLPERPLTTDELREMLDPLVSALAYLHSQGWVHGHLKSSNIMAIGDQLKISCDGVSRAGESKTAVPAEDVWALGLTLVEALTQRREALVPATMPEPFRDIARRCLEPNPAKRWSMADISARLRGGGSKWNYLVPAAVLVAGAVIWLALKPPSDSTGTAAPPASQVEQKKTSPEVTPPAKAEIKPEAHVQPPVQTPAHERARTKAPEKTQAEAPPPASGSGSPADGVVEQVMPDIPSKARSTIHNRAKVSVKVRVDPMGNVSDAKLDGPSPSRYFGDRALKAARLWKFKPGDSDQEWVLRFEIYKAETKVVPVRVAQ